MTYFNLLGDLLECHGPIDPSVTVLLDLYSVKLNLSFKQLHNIQVLFLFRCGNGMAGNMAIAMTAALAVTVFVKAMAVAGNVAIAMAGRSRSQQI